MVSKKDLNSQSSLFLICIGLLFALPEHANADTTLTPCSSCTSSQVQINAALKQGGVVTLNPGTYVIDNQIDLQSGTTLKGLEGAKIVLAPNLRWPRYKPMIHGGNVQNVRITGIEIDGNRDENTYPPGIRTWGRGYYRMLYFYKCKNVEIDHSYLHNNWDDIVWTEKTGNLNFHDNIARKPGHNVLTAYHAGTTYVTNNCMRVYGNSGVHVWNGSGPVYAINNDIGLETGAPHYAGIQVQRSDSIAYNCNNTIHELTPAIGLAKGGQIVTGGCPISPPQATSASSCNVSDFSVASATNDYGATADTSHWTTENVYRAAPGETSTSSTTGSSDTSDSNDINTDTGSAPQVTGHMVGGFGAYTSNAMNAVLSVGGNTIMDYVSMEKGLSIAHGTQKGYAVAARAKGLKLIDDIPDGLMRRWHNNRNTSQLVSDLTAHLKWLLDNPDILETMGGYWMIDDWYSDFGVARPILQKMTALIHQYTPNVPAICGFTGNPGEAKTVSGYMKFASNYSPSGCDMIGIYMYPWGGRAYPMTNLPNILAALKNYGWDPNTRPLIGIPQSYGGKYGYSVPTAAQVQKQTKYFCEQGAKHILYYDFKTGTNATTDAAIRSGIKAGISDCKTIWGN